MENKQQYQAYLHELEGVREELGGCICPVNIDHNSVIGHPNEGGALFMAGHKGTFLIGHRLVFRIFTPSPRADDDWVLDGEV